MIDFAENRDLVVMFGIMGWMMVGNILLQPMGNLYSQGNSIGSYIIMFIYILVWEKYSGFLASEYFALKVIVRPSEKTLNWFVNRSAKTSRPSKNAPNMITTELPLGVKYKDKMFGVVDRVVLKHEFDADSRLIPCKGKINFKGTIITHNSMCTIVVDEVPESCFEIDHGQPIPTYYLANAPGDYNIGPINAMPSITAMNGGIATSQNQVANQLLRENTHLKQSLAAEKRKASYWHTYAIKIESAQKGLTEELNGLLKNPIKFLVAVIQYVQSYVSAGNEIDQLAKQGSFWKRIPTWMFYILGFFGILGFVTINPDFRIGFGQWMGQANNQLFMLLIIMIIAVVAYYIFHKRSGGGK